ncbi:hypothetical protein [Thalassospira alkalitolerans]|uniref:Cache domain-containing protein n=1 Tax=Thalassospira alkalitolerans TaxID=1293890 RepID=A0A1Y2LFK1_9PROT|nr:hypothetical protein [Thalassospira alkalitolerans]OSQ49655.1 hypothetical protein TALK_04890 [Thalassospira alkalitolerans]|tara:strand:- start:17870 stop:18610 length:741 start_codon:yes stop_codon:yes gene_type:complete
MKKWMIVLLGLWLVPAQASAEPTGISLEENVLLMATHVENILNQTDGLMRRSADLLRNDGTMNAVVLQGSLKRFTEQVSAVRALLFIDAKGILRFDTTRHPAANLDLSDRSYFSETIVAGNDGIRIGVPVLGQQSGVPFIPVTRLLRGVSGTTMGVLVAVMTPDAWLPAERACRLCFYSAFTTDGTAVMTSPAQMELDPDFFESLMVRDSLSGVTETKLNTYPARTMWRKLRDYPVVVTSSVVTIY